MLSFVRREWQSLLVVCIAAVLLVLDQCIIPGRALTFDAHIHITTIAQFSDALRQGEFPVQWSNGFAKFGLPLPLFAHQLPIYLGAVVMLLGTGAVAAYKVVLSIGVILSSLTTFIFLRKHFARIPALASAVIFTFAPYRIINVYIRGAMPEIFASIFLPVLLLGLYQAIKEKRKVGLVLVYLSTVGLILSHPMVFVTSIVLAVPYAVWLLWPLQKNWLRAAWLAGAGILGVSTASYYILPVLREMRYFYIGGVDTLFAEGLSLSLEQIMYPAWFFFRGHPGPRGDYVMVGSIEVGVLLAVVGMVIWKLVQNKRKKDAGGIQDSVFWVSMEVLLLLLMTPLANGLYQHVPGFTELQFPWRMLTSYVLVSSVLLALLLRSISNKFQALVAMALVLSVLIARMPQLYSKNSAVYDESAYHYTETNLHTQNMNTIWSQNTAGYPEKTSQYAVLEGTAEVSALSLQNSSREYRVVAETETRMIDYTFYFPGWRVFIDGVETTVEFQDINHRGLILYTVPAGEHTVVVQYGLTKLRLLGWILSGVSVTLACVFFYLLYTTRFLPQWLRFQ